MVGAWLVVLSFVFQIVSGFSVLPHRARGGIAFAQEQQHQKLRSPTDPSRSVHYFTQYLDHNDHSKGTYPQRYFVDQTYWDPNVASSPVFLDINGEAPANYPSGYIDNLAKQHGALMLGLEHRFYGKSVPNNDFSVENLQYLSSRQALADTANFIRSMEKMVGKRKWFAFGGSYSGALSAWFKLKYPDLVVGSHSSSGVVNAIYNFTEFDEQVAMSIGDDCANALRATTKAFEQGVQSGQGGYLRSLFGMSKTTTNGDFFYMLADSAAMGAQYGHKASLCNAMLSGSMDSSALISKFANWTNQFWGSDFGGNCFYDTQCLKSDSSRWQPTSRAWRWTKCSELAYFQIAPAHNSLRSTIYETPEYVRQQCLDIFGQVITNTDEANDYYGGANIQGSNIFFSDFSDDPWQRASVLKTIKPDEPFYLVTCDGCGHCQDLHTPLPSDPKPLADERQQLADFISNLLKD